MILSFIRNVFNGKDPKRILLPFWASELLANVYPTVDWNRVIFYNGLPWFVMPGFHGITLPHNYSTNRINIYIKDFNPEDKNFLPLIIHEAYHVLQYMDIGNGKGFGFARGFIIYYLACSIRQGYHNNPLEKQAYAFEGRFREYINDSNDALNVDALKQKNLIAFKSAYKYTCGRLPLAAGFILVLLFTVLNPLVDLIVQEVRNISQMVLKIIK